MEKMEIINIFELISEDIEKNRCAFTDLLCSCETYKTAKVEIDKTIKALKEYEKELVVGKNRIPIGKIAVFLPSNMPLYSLVLYSFGCLLGGNSVYVRPSFVTRKITKEFFQLLPRLKCLDLYLFDGSGDSFLEKTNNEGFSALIFTGKWESVKEIEKKIDNYKTRLIYCGAGLCPLIVRESADLDLAARIAIDSKIFNTGQDCLCYENFFVHADVFDDFQRILINKLQQCTIGSNLSEQADFGTVISDKITEQVNLFLSKTAGKKIYGDKPFGLWVFPLVIEVDYDDIFVKNEKFSPVFPLIRYSSDKELCERINSQEYALGIGICGNKFPSCTFPEYTIVANNETLFGKEDAHMAFGGRKKSGFIKYRNNLRDGAFLFLEETTVEELHDRF